MRLILFGLVKLLHYLLNLRDNVDCKGRGGKKARPLQLETLKCLLDFDEMSPFMNFDKRG